MFNWRCNCWQRSHRLAALFLAGALPLMAAPADPDPATLVHIDPGSVVDFQLGRTRIVGALPFDVPFYLKTKVPDTTKKLTASSGMRIPPSRSLDSPPACEPDKPLTASAMFDDGDHKSIEVAVDRLDVAKDYCFRFVLERERTADESKKIVKALHEPLARLFQRTNVLDAATMEGSFDFRQQIFKAISRVVAPAVLKPEGTFLDLTNKGFAPLGQRILFETPLQLITQFEMQLGNYRQQRPNTALNKASTVKDVQEELITLQGEIAAAKPADVADLKTAVEKLSDAQKTLTAFDTAIDRIAAVLDEILVDEYDVVATTTANYEARFHWYVSADLGVGTAPDIDHVFRYIGMNIYFRPVNKKAPLEGLDFARRFALTVGLSDSLSENHHTGVLDNRPILLGGGIRINSYFRISAGGMLIKDDNSDPLVTHKKLRVTPYLGASIDFDVANTLSSFFSKLTPK